MIRNKTHKRGKSDFGVAGCKTMWRSTILVLEIYDEEGGVAPLGVMMRFLTPFVRHPCFVSQPLDVEKISASKQMKLYLAHPSHVKYSPGLKDAAQPIKFYNVNYSGISMEMSQPKLDILIRALNQSRVEIEALRAGRS
jgi:hypothetical protein